MQIKLYNSLSKQVEDFQPLEGNKVRMYSCGPTVYNYAHIGNMRAFLFADLLQRVLRTVGGYEVQWVMNITNIDDKTIRDSALGSEVWKSEMGEQTDDVKGNLNKLTLYYEKSFRDDISRLGIDIEDYDEMPRATDYIDEMQELIRQIKANGYAYASEGSIYFDVNAWRQKAKYGRLFKIDFDNFRAGERIDSDQYEREHVSDFVLWKAKKDNEPSWDFELDGENYEGRPGWHIECSAMEKVILGLPFDIHTGGIDLKFPHHEDEIAQSHAGYGVDPTKVWCHNEFLEVEGQKMSKSKGNFFTLRDLEEKGVDPLDIRYSMFASHYASTYNFTFDGIKAGRKARMRIQDYIYDLYDAGKSGDKPADVEGFRAKVFGELGRDLHVPKALAEIFTFINKNAVDSLNEESKKALIDIFEAINRIFAVWELAERQSEDSAIPEEVEKMAAERLESKKAKDWGKADMLRDKIQEMGYIVKDKKDGYDILKLD